MTISYLRKIVESYRSYRSYREDLKFCKNSNIKIFNFWPIQEPESLWFHQFIIQRSILKKGDTVSIYSVFGDRFKMKLDIFRPKIFFTGENYRTLYSDHCLKSVKLSLGSEYVDAGNYLRFPLWYLYFIKPNFKYDDVKNWVLKVTEYNKTFQNQRKRFCSLVASHDPMGFREELFNILSLNYRVDSGGNFLKNTDDLHGLCNNDKELFLKNYRFNICFENSNKNGYVTEKIFEAIVAGSIPIYWGSGLKPEPDILNQTRILFYNPTNENTLQNQIEWLESNPNHYREFYTQDVFMPFASEIIYEKLEQLHKKIKEII